jgi:hypothetical protein
VDLVDCPVLAGPRLLVTGGTRILHPLVRTTKFWIAALSVDGLSHAKAALVRHPPNVSPIGRCHTDCRHSTPVCQRLLLAESTSSVDVPRSRHWSSQRQLSDEVGECVMPARTGLSTSVTGRPLKTLERSLKHRPEIEFQSKERSVLNRRLRYIFGDEIHHRTQDAALAV